jgi:hypothetical protein
MGRCNDLLKRYYEADLNPLQLANLTKDDLLKLKEQIRKQAFLSPEDMATLKEIDNLIIGFKYSGNSSKIKKSKRVTPFNRKRQ